MAIALRPVANIKGEYLCPIYDDPSPTFPNRHLYYHAVYLPSIDETIVAYLTVVRKSPRLVVSITENPEEIRTKLPVDLIKKELVINCNGAVKKLPLPTLGPQLLTTDEDEDEA